MEGGGFDLEAVQSKSKKARVIQDDEDTKSFAAPPDAQQQSSFSLPPRRDITINENEDVLDPLADIGDQKQLDYQNPTASMDDFDPNKYDFCMTMHNANSFKNLVELIAPVLVECDFKVVANSKFRGLVVKCMDESHVAMIVARLKFDEVHPYHLNTPMSFCVPMDMFSTVVKSIKPGGCLEISRLKGGTDITLRGYNQSKQSRTLECKVTMPTIQKSIECGDMARIAYNHMVDMDLQQLRSIVKIANTAPINAENIGFQIEEGVVPRKANQTEERKVSYVNIYVKNDKGPSISQRYRSVTSWNKQQNNSIIVIKNDTNEDDVVDREIKFSKVFDELFATKHLQMFLKSMERANITMRMSPGRPLVIIHPLSGSEDSISRISFILAPKRKTDDDDDDNDNDNDDE